MAIAGWIFGILFLLISICFLFAGTFWVSLLNLVIAAIFIPPVDKFIQQKFNFNFKIWMKAIVIVLCVCMQLLIGVMTAYNFAAPIVAKFQNKIESPNVLLSDIVVASREQKEEFSDFESNMNDIIGACYYAIKTNKSDEDYVLDKCTKSYENLIALEVPAILPQKVIEELQGAKASYVDSLRTALSAENEDKEITSDDAIDFFIDIATGWANGAIKTQKAKKMMGLAPIDAPVCTSCK